uniref:Serpin family B member 5 n=1 Tax=Cercocebus atys TaxID=9531 RepID=A0A2K5P004_CERAT
MDALQLANSAFAVDLFKQLCEKEPLGNVLFSPICLSTSLSLAQVVLHFENVKDVPFGFQTVTSDVNKLSSFYSLKLIKRLYIDKSLNLSTEFISSTKRPYAKELETVDFKDKLEETKGQINNSIKDLTDGKYPLIVLLSITKTVSGLGAIQFGSRWMMNYNKQSRFSLLQTDTKPVQMMNMEATFCMGNIDSINCKIIELPFQNKHLSMFILLPKDVEDESTGLEKIEKQLNSESLLQWTNPSTMANAKVKLSIPKFKVEKMIDPKASLENLGLKHIFSEDTSDFSGMSETKGVALSNVIHKVRLEITEDGGDSIEVPGARILQHKDELNADHPFIYIIRHNKTRNIIFFGKFCSP